eukprot:TRINITY_DN16771_c0_g1_i1.p1 TRINITY_DN16771_c0_g1~~TRINITY_DN16771_c0_g1_i1.p1  ORF type:complete len:144 (+),score=15.68 TRINITY_DN16771_c0_g1_i1:62-493(+)
MSSLAIPFALVIEEEASNGSFSSESEAEASESEEEVESPRNSPTGSPIGMRRCAAFRGREQFSVAHSHSQAGARSRKVVESMQSATVSCSICLFEDQSGVITDCGHGFCQQCLTRWIRTKIKNVVSPSCPNCRTPIKLSPSDE